MLDSGTEDLLGCANGKVDVVTEVGGAGGVIMDAAVGVDRPQQGARVLDDLCLRSQARLHDVMTVMENLHRRAS